MDNQNTILLGPQHDISGFCTTDESRWALTGVHYNSLTKKLEATDGRMIISLSVQESKGEYPIYNKQPGLAKDFLIPGKFLKQALEKIPQRTTLPILKKAQVETECADGGLGKVQHITIATTDLDAEHIVRSKQMETDFPNTAQVFPKEPANWRIMLNASLLKRIADYANAHCSEKYRGILIEFWTEDEPARFTMRVGDEQQEAIAVLMPMKMK